MTPALKTKYNTDRPTYRAMESKPEPNHTLNGSMRQTLIAAILTEKIFDHCESKPKILNTDTIEGNPIHIQCHPKPSPPINNYKSKIINPKPNAVTNHLQRTHKIQIHHNHITFNYMTYPVKITFKNQKS